MLEAIADSAAPIPPRPPLRYFGSKWTIAPWIIERLPPHVCYCEPFAGGAAVLLRKPRSAVEVYNDRDGEVCNFFRVLREQPDELIRAIDLTPFAREEYELARLPAAGAVEAARRLYICVLQSHHGGRGQWRQGWRWCRVGGRGSDFGGRACNRWQVTDHLYAAAARLKHVQIEHDDAAAVIDRYDAATTVFYVDPPYLPETRCGRWRNKSYQHEMTLDEHAALAARLHGIRGAAIVSGYPSAAYDAWYAGWRREERGARCDGNAKSGGRGCARREVIWCSPGAAAPRQGRLL